ncbi:MAG TPA: hypothetical protein VFG55_07520, partial [Rhodanobacteraceae bacterium]|nr:hypothetical protein [Rhodanobacteraceae bacterium]
AGHGDPIVLYDQLADRWLISQFAGSGIPTDECIAVSTTSDATGSYNRYGFHLGTNFFDYPHIGVWPDGYYMSMNILNSSGTAYFGPQPFVFERAAMLAGLPATFISFPELGSSHPPILPADLDGSTLPPVGAPNPFLETPDNTYPIYAFHADFATPANSTFTLLGSPAAAGYTQACTGGRSCVPQLGTSTGLDGIADRLMFRLAYRNFGDHESLVGNFTVSSGGVSGVRWFELRHVTSAPISVFQQSTYQPDSTWRWLGSVAMDATGNLAVGYSASSASINPQIRYAGRLVSDPINTLAQGEAHLFDGTGSQTGTGSRWGDYSDLTVDPVDDCTFWYTNEYYATTGQFNWRTRIGNFRFAGCGAAAPPTVTKTFSPTSVEAGESSTATLTLGNTQASAAMLTAALSDSLPSGLVVAAAPNASTTCSGGTVTATAGASSFSLSSGAQIPATGSCAVTVDVSAAAAGSYVNTIPAGALQTDLGNNANPAVATLTVIPPGVGGTFPPDETFEEVTAPALPTDWPTAASGAGVPWVTVSDVSDTAPNSAHASDFPAVSDMTLDTPTFTPAAGATLSFRHRFNLESTFDGAVLEISIGGGAFQDFVDAGGVFTTGGYNATISSSFGSPIAGRAAWSGNSGGFVDVAGTFPAAAIGQPTVLRFRTADDNSVAP